MFLIYLAQWHKSVTAEFKFKVTFVNKLVSKCFFCHVKFDKFVAVADSSQNIRTQQILAVFSSSTVFDRYPFAPNTNSTVPSVSLNT